MKLYPVVVLKLTQAFIASCDLFWSQQNWKPLSKFLDLPLIVLASLVSQHFNWFPNQNLLFFLLLVQFSCSYRILMQDCTNYCCFVVLCLCAVLLYVSAFLGLQLLLVAPNLGPLFMLLYCQNMMLLSFITIMRLNTHGNTLQNGTKHSIKLFCVQTCSPKQLHTKRWGGHYASFVELRTKNSAWIYN